MRIERDEKNKIIAVWLSRKEKEDEQLRRKLREKYAEWHRQKYMVAEYLSGERDVVESTSALLLHNRDQMAEKEARRAREEEGGRISIMERLREPPAREIRQKPVKHWEPER